VERALDLAVAAWLEPGELADVRCSGDREQQLVDLSAGSAFPSGGRRRRSWDRRREPVDGRIRQSEVDRMLGEQASNRPATPSGGPRPPAAEPARDLISSLITNPEGSRDAG
jgi:hypothetical protein